MSIICSTTHLLSPLAMASDTVAAKKRRQGYPGVAPSYSNPA